jgi:hypothetical protein
MILASALLLSPFLCSASSPSADPDYTTVWRTAGNWFLAHGEFEIQTVEPGVDRYRILGSGVHVLEIGSDDWSNSLEFDVTASGEFYVSEHGFLIDPNRQDQVAFTTGSEDLLPCDGAYAGVQSVSVSGGCWAGPIINTETGITRWNCTLTSGGCNATITYTNGNTVTPTWNCGGTNSNNVRFKGSTGEAWATGAASGC